MAEAPISVVVPAHDEAAVIGRLLTALAKGRVDGDEVVVVCDGCTDATAEVARTFAGVRVLEIEHGGKPAALNAGDATCTVFPRFFVDADVAVTSTTLRETAVQLSSRVLAGAPSCHVDVRRSSMLVRGYYDVWTRLPYLSRALLGSGVIGLSREGRARFERFPDLIGDDEYVRRRFRVDERIASTHGRFTITAPRTLGALIRIKTRSRLGILQLDRIEGPAPADASPEAGSRAALRLARDPRRWASLGIYLLVRLVVQVRVARRARRGDFSGWARDDTSRAEVPGA